MDDPAFTTQVDDTTQLILVYSAQHNLAALKPLLRTPGAASVQDPETGTTPLHAAIGACSASSTKPSSTNPTDPSSDTTEKAEDVDMEMAKKVVEELFLSGAIWNDLDKNDETPGCLAWRLGLTELYEMCVNAGVRAEVLLGLMGGYQPLEGEASDEEDEEGDNVETPGFGNGDVINGEGDGVEKELAVGPAEEEKKDVNSEDYLKSTLTFTDDKLLDADANGVMMAWETDIMRRTVDALIPELEPGARILNIGFGMGIVDRMFRDTKPLSHHIVEAHPAVIAKLEEEGHDFGKSWEESAPEGGSYKIHKGKWQDICPALLQSGEVFDAIYFDTFGEDYAQLKLFFTEFVPGLMDAEGRFGWFNGLGADRRVCYDVYCRVVEMDLCDAGCDVEWTDVPVEVQGEGEGEWEGVRRRYWVLEKYRLPVARFLG